MSKFPSKIKVVNLEVKIVLVIAFGVHFKVGKWIRKVNFLIMQLDDFDVILADEFLMALRAALLPFIGVMLIFNEKQPCYVPARLRIENNRSSKGNGQMVLAM